MIRVCHISTVHSPLDSRVFYKECLTLVKVGYNTTLIAQHEKNETVDGVRIIALPGAKNRVFRMFGLPMKALLLALKQKADICHFHDPELIPAGVFLKIMGKKVIYDIHEDYSRQILSKQYLPKITRNVIAFLTKTIEYISSKIFDGIITATDDILKNFAHHNKAVSVRNFPILSAFLHVKKPDDNESGVFNLIYIGGLDEIRGISQIIKGLEFIDSDRPFKLILCGKFYPTGYEKEVRRLKGFEKVEYLGWKDQNDIPEFLSKADVGIICFMPEPNHIKAMPNKLFEYMAAGLPVIASNFPLWKEIVECNKCGICVDPLEPMEIAKAIKYLMEHPRVRKEMGENGRAAVLEKLNWEKETEKLLALYEVLLKGKTKKIDE